MRIAQIRDEGSRSWLMLMAAVLLATTIGVAAQDAHSSEADILAILKNPNASLKQKSDACLFLARCGTRNAVPVLASLLPDPQLNHMARYALEAIPDPAVDEALRAALGTTQGRALVGVIISVGVRRDVKAVPELTRLLQDADTEVAQAAARALGRIGTAAAAQAIQKALPQVAPANQLAFCEGLFRCAERLQAEGQRDLAIAIYDQLRALPAAPHQVRAGALRGAVLSRGADGLPILAQALRDPDYVRFAAAVRTALELRLPGVTKALTDALDQAPQDRQIVLVQTLGDRADPQAVPTVSALAKAGAKPVRLAAIRGLAALGQPSSAPVLVGLLQEPDRDLAQAAQESLAALPGPEAEAAISALVTSANETLQLAGIELIARRRMHSGLPALRAATRHTNPTVRAAATKRFSELAAPTELPYLLELMLDAKESKDLDVAEQAAISLAGRATDPEAAAAAVRTRISQATPEQKAALLRVLAAVGGPSALESMRVALADPNSQVRRAAIRALGSWKNAEAAPDLLALAKKATDPTEKTLCLRSFLDLTDNPDLPAPQRLDLCRQATDLAQSTEEKRLWLAAVGNIPTLEAVDLLLPYLDQPTLKNEAAAAILNAAERMLRGQAAAKVAPQLVPRLEKTSETVAGSSLAKRAGSLLEQARKRAAGRRATR
jgi:HEAT repeat protein